VSVLKELFVKISEMTILVVDDEEMIREVLVEFLQSMGAKTLEAANGLEGAQIFKENQNLISVVVSDVRMPKGNGLEMGREIRKLAPKMPIIFVSGFNDASENEINSIKPLAILVKPFDLDELSKLLEKA
jgi:two-component system cell cycle sensor histidine kinase/response regulator CckA